MDLNEESVSAGGDPHFFGFFESFSFMGECDLLLLSTKFDHRALVQNNKIETAQIHIRTTRKLNYSYISGIAAKIGPNIIEVKQDGSLWINKQETYSKELANNVQEKGLDFALSQSFKGKKRMIIVYEIDLHNGLSFKIRANLKNKMLFIGTDGSFPSTTQGLLGSPTKPGLFTRDGVNMAGGDTDSYAETWQIRPGTDPKLFMEDRKPQYPSKCLYPKSEIDAASSIRGRKLLEGESTHFKVTLKDAETACKDLKGARRDFCIEDTMRTGDLSLALDEFYNN